MRHQPVHVQSAVAQAEGHSIEVAQRVYNIIHPAELVEKARKGMEEVAAGGMKRFFYEVRSCFVFSNQNRVSYYCTFL